MILKTLFPFAFLALAFAGLAIYLWWCQILTKRRMAETKIQYDDYLASVKELNRESVELGKNLLDEARAIRTLLEKRK